MKFIKFPWQIYRNDPNWVPPLIMDRKKFLSKEKNPFFKENPTEFYLAYRDGQLVGRIAAILNKQHNEFHQENIGFFGFLEAVNDREVFKALLDTAKDWLRQFNCQAMRGPMNPSTNDEVGFLIDGFDTPPYFMMTHNPPYYVEIMEELGYRKAKDLYAYYLDEETVQITPKVQRVYDVLQKRYPVKLRTVDMKHFDEELEVVREIYNDAWARNWGFVPLTPAEFDFIADDFKKILDPDLVLIGEYKGDAAGFLLALPNYNEVFQRISNGRLFPFGLFKFLWYKNKIKTLRIITLGIKQKYQPLGLGALFYIEIIKRGLAKGYRSGEMSWILEDNDLMNKAAQMLGGKVYKTYRIYETDL
ncbi:MAG: hypothetical protein D6748_13780 [Calditrichaeota bacterium]|nr:MAG: hypothetical protein D6748_13780 [Calditrichota bacterium]